MADLTDFYSQLEKQYLQVVYTLKKQAFLVSALRLLVFAGVVYGIYIAIVRQESLFVYLVIILLALFLWLVKLSQRLNAKRQLNENLVAINQNELNLLKGLDNRFANDVNKVDRNDFTDDLDIFGDRSLFALINRATTWQGINALAENFKQPVLNTKEIYDQQLALKILAPANDRRQNIMASSMAGNLEHTQNTSLLLWVQQPLVLANNSMWAVIRIVLPVINLFTLVISLQIEQFYPITLSVVLSWIVVGSISKYTNKENISLGKKQEQLKAYAEILNGFNKVSTGDSTLLINLQNETSQASAQIYKLSQLANLLDQRMNVVVNFLLNSLLLYDVQCMLALEKWKQHNQENLAKWMDQIGVIERLVSLSTYVFNHPENTYPTFTNELKIEASDLYHPLIPLNENVSNDLNVGNPDKLLLITGSNMSGKTTWLRTVGINIVMAQSGLPVCASSFTFHPLRIYSSIRINDSLQEHTSYFMAELKKLKNIIDHLKKGNPSLVLIDEILRGTNSDDKYFGSEAFVRKLLGFNALSLFATHDLKLSEMEDQLPEQVANYCFESTISDNELSFDYKILKGVAKNKNATFLMKKMEII